MGAATVASVDGRIMAPEDATISILDDGLLRGDGAFEVIKLYDGHPFRLGAHIARIARSAAAIHLDFDAGALDAEVAALLAAEGSGDGCLRIVLTRGGRRLLTLEDLPDWGASVRIALVTLSPSEILAGVKSISYAANMHATRLAVAAGAEEAVYVDAGGTVLEAPTSSVFWTTADGNLRTPALDAGILDSITRAVVLERLEVEEGSFPKADLIESREAFLASTTREIQPIAAVDGHELEIVGGERTAAARAALEAAVAAEREEAGASVGPAGAERAP
ncbi:MAG TPA: aminotransferase class IV [Solirubrobacterales bacterium]|nr:aminotransferase class IV [Solirubrobacterales bacterium]